MAVDKEFIARLQQNDSSALDIFYLKYKKTIRLIIKGYYEKLVNIPELFSEIFIYIVKYIDTFTIDDIEIDQRFEEWLQILVNRYIENEMSLYFLNYLEVENQFNKHLLPFLTNLEKVIYFYRNNLEMPPRIIAKLLRLDLKDYYARYKRILSKLNSFKDCDIKPKN